MNPEAMNYEGRSLGIGKFHLMVKPSFKLTKGISGNKRI